MSIDLMNQLAEELPESSKRFVDRSFAISRRIHFLLEEAGITQRDLADLLGKAESEISKWLSGQHNLTLRTLTLIEAALGADLFQVGESGNNQESDIRKKGDTQTAETELSSGKVIQLFPRNFQFLAQHNESAHTATLRTERHKTSISEALAV